MKITYTENRKPLAFSHLTALPLICWLAVSITTGALAFEPSDDPIRVEADSAQFDDKKGLATYQGNVLIEQGSTRLNGDKVVVKLDDDGLISIEASGQPATLSKRASKSQSAIKASAKKITYLRKTTSIILLDGARLEQGKNSFQGNTIEYNTATQIVDARGNGKANQPGGRVELIFHPKSNTAITGDRNAKGKAGKKDE